MTKAKFRKLKVGDKVTLKVVRGGYFNMLRWPETAGHPLRCTVPAGSSGVVGAIKVPSVRTGKDDYFVCVDFPDNPIRYMTGSGPSTLVQRVAAYAEDLV